MNKLTNEEIWQQFTEGIDCAQVVLRYFADDLGVDKNLLTKIASPFTGGMYKGMTCGAVTGAYMVWGSNTVIQSQMKARRKSNSSKKCSNSIPNSKKNNLR